MIEKNARSVDLYMLLFPYPSLLLHPLPFATSSLLFFLSPAFPSLPSVQLYMRDPHPYHMDSDKFFVVSDIGGTNARFELWRPTTNVSK